jgi:hypothetical protein
LRQHCSAELTGSRCNATLQDGYASDLSGDPPTLDTCLDIQPHRRSARSKPAAHRVSVILGVLAMVAAGCTRPADRPLDGARPGSVASANTTLLASASPVSTAPTQESTAIPVSSPPPSPVASPTATGRGPIISTIQPQSGANVPVGPVTISARISATSDVSEVTMLVDGQATRPSSTGDARTPTYSITMPLAAGQHQARIQVRDDQGRLGGFSWTFNVGGAAPAPSPAPKR